MNRHLNGRLHERGVSLIEAVVAMGVMAFGMMAVVGLQVTLRANSDIAKQRSEAVRIAQESLEDWRAFSAIPHTAGVWAYDDISPDGPTAIPDPNHYYNTTYQRTRSVVVQASPPVKTLFVTVTWADRTGAQQSVQLNTFIAGVLPEVAGSLALPFSLGPGRQPSGRNPSIPPTAKNLGDGRSGFVPPQPGGGTVAWVFSNTTGLIVGVCAAAGVANSSLLTSAIADSCVATKAQLLSGFVSFASTAAQPNAAQAQVPSGLPLNLHLSLAGITSGAVPVPGWACFDDGTTVSAPPIAGTAVSYFCAITSGVNGKWAGRSRIDPLVGGWSIAANGAGNYKICRYTTLADDGSAASKNSDHPLDYTEPPDPLLQFYALTNQNFLVISALHVCPTDVAAAGDFVNSNTRLHQDGSVTYP